MTCLKIKSFLPFPVRRRHTLSSQFWQQLTGLTSLKELFIEGTKIYLDEWELIWNTLSSRLTNLGLNGVTISERDVDSTETSKMAQTISPATPTSCLQQEAGSCTIEKLKLRYVRGWTPIEQFEWIQKCPRLRSLSWRPRYTDSLRKSGTSLLGFLIKDGRSLPALTFLKLEDYDHKADEMLAFLMTRTPGYRPRVTSTSESPSSLSYSRPFQGLDFKYNVFDSTSWRWMTSHLGYFKTISVLYFGGSPSVTGAIVQEMLCTLPNLTNFAADEVRDRDIWDDPRPWVCLKVEEFALRFLITGAVSAARHSMDRIHPKRANRGAD